MLESSVIKRSALSCGELTKSLSSMSRYRYVLCNPRDYKAKIFLLIARSLMQRVATRIVRMAKDFLYACVPLPLE